MKGFTPAFAVCRADLPGIKEFFHWRFYDNVQTNWQEFTNHITVKEVVYSIEKAKSEVNRLQSINTSPDVHYFWTSARVEQPVSKIIEAIEADKEAVIAETAQEAKDQRKREAEAFKKMSLLDRFRSEVKTELEALKSLGWEFEEASANCLRVKKDNTILQVLLTFENLWRQKSVYRDEGCTNDVLYIAFRAGDPPHTSEKERIIICPECVDSPPLTDSEWVKSYKRCPGQKDLSLIYKAIGKFLNRGST